MTRHPLRVWLLWLAFAGACSDSSGSDSANRAGQSGNADGGTAGSSANAGSSSTSAGSGQSGRGATGTAASTAIEARCGESVQAPRCFDSGWCWELPAPFGGTLYSVDGVRDGSSIFAVGAIGSAFRSCNGQWSAIDTGVEVDLFAVWHPKPDLGIAVGGGGTVLRWDGSAWSKLQSPTDRSLRAVWGSEDRIWLGGDADDSGVVLFELAGSDFTRVSLPSESGTVRAIDGRSGEDVFVVTSEENQAQTFHYDGSRWSTTSASVDGVMQDARAFADGPTLALVNGAQTDTVMALGDDGTWQPVYTSDFFELSALFTAANGRPAVLQEAADFALPGEALVFVDGAFVPGDERMRALPREIWNGDALAVGVGEATLLLERSDNPVWTQSPAASALGGKPVFLGSKSDENALVLITEHEIHRRDAQGWSRLARRDQPLTSGAVEEKGTVIVAQRDDGRSREPGSVFFRDAIGWRSPVTQVQHAPRELLANANLSVWSRADDTIYQYGQRWTDLREYCEPLTHHPRRMRQGPERGVWVIIDEGVAEIDIMSLMCTVHPYAGELADVAWLNGSELWAISRDGELGQWQDGQWITRKQVLADDATVIVSELLPAAGNAVWVVLARSAARDGYAFGLRRVDLAGDITVGEEVLAPGEGLLWADGDVLYEAVPGGVLRRAAR